MTLGLSNSCMLNEYIGLVKEFRLRGGCGLR
jgi:hypothetical protein